MKERPNPYEMPLPQTDGVASPNKATTSQPDEPSRFGKSVKFVLGLILAAAVAGGVSVIHSLSGPRVEPDLANMRTEYHYSVEYQMPGNWYINRSESEDWGSGMGYVLIETRQNAVVEVLNYSSPLARPTAEKHVRISLDGATGQWGQTDERQTSSRADWASGSVRVKDPGVPWQRLIVFVRELPDGDFLEIRSTVVETEFQLLEPALHAILDSVQLR